MLDDCEVTNERTNEFIGHLFSFSALQSFRLVSPIHPNTHNDDDDDDEEEKLEREIEYLERRLTTAKHQLTFFTRQKK